jgi:high-affinity nickel permease
MPEGLSMKGFACVVMLVCIIGMVTGALMARDAQNLPGVGNLPSIGLGDTLISTGFVGFLLACVLMVLADIRTTLGWKPAGTVALVANEKAITEGIPALP